MNFDLLDSGSVNLGIVSIKSLKNDIYIGRFFPNDRFENYKPIFLEYELLVESQQFSAVDELELKISSMGFFVVPTGYGGVAFAVFDLQIMRDSISFQIASPD